MSKISISAGEKLLEEGILNREQYKALVDKGYIAVKGREKRAMKGKNGELVYPKLYFENGRKAGYTAEMTKLSNKIYSLIGKATFLPELAEAIDPPAGRIDSKDREISNK